MFDQQLGIMCTLPELNNQWSLLRLKTKTVFGIIRNFAIYFVEVLQFSNGNNYTCFFCMDVHVCIDVKFVEYD